MTEGSKVIENSDNILLNIIMKYMENFYERRVCGSGIRFFLDPIIQSRKKKAPDPIFF